MRRGSDGMRKKSATKINSACGFGERKYAVQRREFILLRAARVQLLHIADEKHLERRHQRRRLRPIQRFEDRSFPKDPGRRGKNPSAPAAQIPSERPPAALQQKVSSPASTYPGFSCPFPAAAASISATKRPTAAKARAPARAAQRANPQAAQPMNASFIWLQNTLPGAPGPVQKSDTRAEVA
jgi:hypothetical protein